MEDGPILHKPSSILWCMSACTFTGERQMKYRMLVAPVLGLVMAGAAAAQTPQNPQPARPAPPQPATPRSDPTPSQPATPPTTPQPPQPASAPGGTIQQPPLA